MANLPGIQLGGLPPIPGLWVSGVIPSTPVSSSDTLSLSLSDSGEVSNNLVTHFRSDTLGIGISEEDINEVSIEAFDNFLLSLTETARRAVGIYSQDSINVVIGDYENPMTYGYYSTDDLDLSVEDSFVDWKPNFIRTDSLNLTLGETIPARAFSQVDTLSVAATESIVARALQVLDSLNIALPASQSVVQGGTIVLLRTDTLGISLAETARTRLSVLLSDALGISISDSGGLSLDTEPVTSSDAFGITLVDTAFVSVASLEDSWLTDEQPWGGAAAEESNKYPVFLVGNRFYRLDPTSTRRGSEIITSVLERIGLVPSDPTNILLMTEVHPLLRAPAGTVLKIYVGMQDSPEDAVTWDGPYSYVVGSSYFVDPVVSGRYIALRIEVEGQPAWRLLSLDLTLKEIGKH